MLSSWQIGRQGKFADPAPNGTRSRGDCRRAEFGRCAGRRSAPTCGRKIHLGRPTTIEPEESAARILRRRGGYCYHLNGAFSLLLRALGYEISWHRAGVQGDADSPPGTEQANHLALTASGLASDESPDGRWLVDVGLGDALYEPLPLRPGEYAQGPFRYRLRRSEVGPGGWRLDHDPRGAFVGMDWRPGIAVLSEFAAKHHWLSTSPDSGFVKTASAQRRDVAGVDLLRGRVLTRLDAAGRADRTIETAADWYAVLADVYGLDFPDVNAPTRDALWRRVVAAHEARFGGGREAGRGEEPDTRPNVPDPEDGVA